MKRGGKSGGNALDRWRQKHKEQEEKRGGDWPIKTPEGVKFVKQEKKEDRCFKLVPYIVKDPKHPDADVGDLSFRRPYKVHKNIGPDEKSIICLGTWDRSDAICKERERFRAAGDDKAQQALNASRRGLYLVVDVDDGPDFLLLDQPDNMGKAPGFGRMLEEEILRLDRAAPAPWEEDGQIVEVRFGEDSWGGKKFYPATKINLVSPNKSQKKVMDEIDYESAPCLDDALNRLSPDEIERIMFGVEEEEEKEEEKEEKSPPRRGRKPEPEPEPEPKDSNEEKTERIKEILEDELDEADHDDIVALAEEFDIELEKDDIRASRKGDKNVRKELRKTIREALEEMLGDLEEMLGEEETTPEPEPPPKMKRGTSPKQKDENEGKDRCPHGHNFGDGCDEHDECKKCKVWEDCADKQDAQRKK